MATDTVIRPSPQLQAKMVLTWVIVFLCLLPVALLGLIPEVGGTFAAIWLGANVLWLVIALLVIPHYYRSISYELGEDEIIVRKGVVTKTVQRVPYHMVTNVEVKRGPLDRLVGIGGIHVHCAGYSNQVGAEAVLDGLPNYEEVEERVISAVRRARGMAPGPRVELQATSAGGTEVVALLNDIRAQISAIRELLATRPPQEQP